MRALEAARSNHQRRRSWRRWIRGQGAFNRMTRGDRSGGRPNFVVANRVSALTRPRNGAGVPSVPALSDKARGIALPSVTQPRLTPPVSDPGHAAPARGVPEPRVRRLLGGRAARPCLPLPPIPAFELPARRRLGLRAVPVWKLVAGESLSGESHTSKVRIISPASAWPYQRRLACRFSLRSPAQRGANASPSRRNWPHARAGAQRNRPQRPSCE